ncbi:MAG: 3D domain-containing protein [Spirochaetes bacterium]|jgi:3D (Asp-Asp-Asp) domain-containing protein|nr:3D domain-containing protein [Spirochaetota bacterium]
MIRKAVVLGGIAGIVTILAAFVFSEAMVKKEPYVERLLESEHFRNGRTVAMVCELTAYCPGACCNTEHVTGDNGELAIDWSDQLAVGGLSIRALLDSGIRPAAVDSSLIPFGSIIDCDGVLYVALDRGGAIRGTRIDLAMDAHDECVEFGRRRNRTVTVHVPRSPSAVVGMIREKYGLRGDR